MNENIELVQSLYAAFHRGDVPFILSRLTDDVVWRYDAPASIAYSGTRRGPAEAAGFFAGIAATEQEQLLEALEFHAAGNEVMTLCQYSGSVKATGKPFSVHVAHFFTVRDGKVSRFLNFTDSAAMLEAHTASAAHA